MHWDRPTPSRDSWGRCVPRKEHQLWGKLRLQPMFARQQHKHKSIYTTPTSPITFPILSHQLLFSTAFLFGQLLKQQNKYIRRSLYLLIKLMGPSMTPSQMDIRSFRQILKGAGAFLYLVRTTGGKECQGSWWVKAFILSFFTDNLSFCRTDAKLSFFSPLLWTAQQICFNLPKPGSHWTHSEFTTIRNPD